MFVRAAETSFDKNTADLGANKVSLTLYDINYVEQIRG